MEPQRAQKMMQGVGALTLRRECEGTGLAAGGHAALHQSQIPACDLKRLQPPFDVARFGSVT